MELRLSVRELQACQECRDQAQNTCSETRERRVKHVFKSGLHLIQPQRVDRSSVSLWRRESTSSKAEKSLGVYDRELANTFAHSCHAWFCVVQPAHTCSSCHTCRFWLFLSRSEGVLESQRPRGLKKRKKIKFCAYEGKAGNVNNLSGLAESWR